MTGAQKNRQRQVQRAKMERARAAQQRAAERRKRLIAAGAIVAALGLIAVFVFVIAGDDDNTDVTAAGTSSTLPTTDPAPSPASAAGKPCVKTADPTPDGAPEVPVKEGAPPEKLVTEDLMEGTGAVVPPESTITVNYIGVACSTGKIFDYSYGKDPATFPLTGVIPGWTQGIPGMKVGGKRLLGIPSALAYGPQGSPPDIGPDEPLWFVVEVLASKAAPVAP
ncbi:MAG: FKBP-type peptidyl-prolyl cis-trans isomerase [Acidimicrobiales bacterium]